MLALVINHPFLFDELSEIFAEIVLPVAWEPLRQALFDVLTRQPLDVGELGVHLSASGYGALLEDILGPATTRHAAFVKADTPEDEVRAAWLDMWSRSYSRHLDRELAVARSDPNRSEDQALERISRLGERRYYGVNASSEDHIESGTDHEAVVARAIAEALSAAGKERRRDDAIEFEDGL
ncbi:MAG: hypothetical protein JO255_15335 [Alphaproteobacteria bacterium]|nr:hypothetical protein [Alphaproteobacteria bacterium]